MKRLWIRAHALRDAGELAHQIGAGSVRVLPMKGGPHGPNAMLVAEVSDELAAAIAKDGYLMAAGRILKDGEEPPYLGEEGKQED